MKTKSQVEAAKISAALRARTPLLWVVTREETRVQGYLFQAAAAANYVARFWDVAAGATEFDGRSMRVDGSQDPGVMLTDIANRARDTVDNGYGESRPNPIKAERNCWIMRDLPVWLAGITGATACRQLRNHATTVAPSNRAQPVIVLSPSADVPPELSGLATVIQWPLPDRAEVGAILDSVLESNNLPLLSNGDREAAIGAAVGLSGEEIQACYGASLVLHRRIEVSTVADEKKRVISKGKLIEWIDPLPDGMDAVGGLDVLKSWIVTRRKAFSPAARKFGLPAPKGMVLVGISGCGKTLTAKASATGLGLPIILRLDMGALKGKYVGQSEANTREIFQTIDAVGPCVVWIDEIEKAMQGATSGSADGGVSADQLGTFLTWMQERQGEAFVIATANDISQLPPELSRKGRFDEVFWIDLPTQSERQAILATALKAHGRTMDGIDASAVSDACADFTGAEVAALVPDALFAAFDDDSRELTTQDLLTAARATTPLAKQSEAKIRKMRSEALGRFRPATSPESGDGRNVTSNVKRMLDIA